MKLIIDTDAGRLTEEAAGQEQSWPLFSAEAFSRLNEQWLAVGWSQRYSYSFTWMGRPVVQLPEDMLRIQELIFQLRPDVIVETGVAHGGSLIFYASLCRLLGKGRVIGIDIEIRQANRQAIEAHALSGSIILIEGSSVDPVTLQSVRGHIRPDEKVLVILDSNHSRDHVRQELEAYSLLVGPGSYLVATDGIMKDLAAVPGGSSDWTWNNPARAAVEFAGSHPEFQLQEPPRLFDESKIPDRVTYWPSAYLKRVA